MAPEIDILYILLPNRFPDGITTIEQLCTFLRNQILQGGNPANFLEQIQFALVNAGVNATDTNNIMLCVLRAILKAQTYDHKIDELNSPSINHRE